MTSSVREEPQFVMVGSASEYFEQSPETCEKSFGQPGPEGMVAMQQEWRGAASSLGLG